MIHLLACTVGGRALLGLVVTVLLSASSHFVLFSRLETAVSFFWTNDNIESSADISSAETASSTESAGIDNDVEPLSRAMDEAVRLLYGPDNVAKAEEYLRRISAAHPNGSFRFYVYDSLPKDRTWSYLSRCIERKLNRPGKKGNKYGNQTSNCDWGTSICSETTRSSGYYSSRRFNRNGDVILSRLFSEYKGGMRTYDTNEADVFIVPYASTADCACRNTKARCFKIKSHMIAENVLDHLEHLSPSTLPRHVFFNSAQGDVAQPIMREMPLLAGMEPMRGMIAQGENSGQVIMPYANTNEQYQPNHLMSFSGSKRSTLPWKSSLDRKYAVSAFLFRTSIKSDGQNVRQIFFDKAQEYVSQNQTIGGRKFFVSDKIVDGEEEIFRLYKDSIFCPCLHGDTPGQKRIFDVWLSGCIPVVLEYDQSHETGYPSHFEPGGSSIRIVYPFVRGNFFDEPDMGIDYHQLLVPINGTCGVPCLIPTLEKLLVDEPQQIQQIQDNIAQVVSLFSFGMEDNTLRYPDAVAAALVQIRHYLFHLRREKGN